MPHSFFFRDFFREFDKQLSNLNFDLLSEAMVMMDRARENGNKIIAVGNGGSASVASHFVLDCLNGAGVRAVSFNQPDLITCLANDFGYEHWVSKALERHGESGDLLVVISSGGQSPNLINACTTGRKMKLGIITLTGFRSDNTIRSVGDLNLWVDSQVYNIVEMVHQAWLLAIVDAMATELGSTGDAT